MGEIPMKATRARARIEIAHAHQVLLLFFAILIIGTAMRAMTAGRIPLKILSTTGLSLNAEKTIAIIRIIKKEGIIDPRVAAMLPFMPLRRYPAKMEILTAITPGADCERATISGSSSSGIHFFRDISS